VPTVRPIDYSDPVGGAALPSRVAPLHRTDVADTATALLTPLAATEQWPQSAAFQTPRCSGATVLKCRHECAYSAQSSPATGQPSAVSVRNVKAALESTGSHIHRECSNMPDVPQCASCISWCHHDLQLLLVNTPLRPHRGSQIWFVAAW
jgi:hypothetical protein